MSFPCFYSGPLKCILQTSKSLDFKNKTPARHSLSQASHCTWTTTPKPNGSRPAPLVGLVLDTLSDPATCSPVDLLPTPPLRASAPTTPSDQETSLGSPPDWLPPTLQVSPEMALLEKPSQPALGRRLPPLLCPGKESLFSS